jgi:spermidine synthase
VSARPGAGLPAVTLSEQAGVRYLHLDSIWVQGAMRMAAPERIELEYVRRMMAWLLARPVERLTRGHAMQLGLGAGAITRFCHGPLRLDVTAVEINPAVISACRQWFRLPVDGPRLRVLEADAATVIADADRAGTVDSLCVDLYDHEAAGPVLDSVAFYRGCARLLAPGGVLSVNLFGRDASFERSLRRIGAAFGHREGADRVRTLQPTREGNTVVLALRDEPWPDRAELALRAQAIESRFGLPARRWLRLMRRVPAQPAASTAR